MKKFTIFLLFLCPIILHGQNSSEIVGSLGGTINASMYGGATYFIPLELPKGVCNMQPELGITYNSQGGNGLLGYGWNISGISSITRSGSTLFHDGTMSTADFSADDRFVFDGMRLIQTGTSGNNVFFKTEQDDFSKIVFYKENGYYTKCDVWLENGNLLKYGYSSNSKLMASDGNNAIKWMVSSITDRNGNTISYTYETVSGNSDIYISQISYTSNEQAGLSPEFTISFTYSDNRFDSYHYYIAGNKVTSKKLLTRIDIAKSGNTIESYSFTYDGNSNRMYNLLTNITLSKGQYELNPTVIEWNTDDSDIQNNTMTTQQINQSILNEFTFVGDVNGDGYTDLLTVPYKPYNGNVTLKVFLNNMDGSFNLTPNTTINAPDSLEWIHVFDINADGYDDVVLQTLTETTVGNNTTYTSGFIVFESQGGTSFTSSYSTTIRGKVLAKVGDFLGEGKNGILLLKVTPWNVNANAFYIDCYPQILRYTNGYSLNTVNTSLFECGLVLSDDFNGDGRSELLIFNTQYRNIYTFGLQSGSYTMSLDSESFNCSEYTSFFTGDFNDDGKADIMYNSVFNNAKYVMLSTGTGFTDPIYVNNADLTGIYFPQMQLYNCSLANVSQSYQYGINFSDIDGDGKSDIIYYEGNKKPKFFRGFTVNDGTNPTGDFKIVYQANNSDIEFKNQYFTMGNFMGVDHSSFIAVDPQNASTTSDDIVNIYTFPSTVEVFSVSSITNGYGKRTDLEYCYLTPGNGTFYHFNNRPYANDMKPFPVPLLAMKSYTEHIGANSYKTSFEYTNFIMHRKGRGFIGFDKVQKTSYINNSLVKKEVGRTETATMGINAIALPACDSVFIYSSGNAFLSKVTEYTFDNVRNTSHITSDGKYLITRPAMTSQKTKNFNPDHPGSVLSVEIIDYDYSYSNNNTYTYAYHCNEVSKGVNGTDCSSPSSCGYRNTVSTTFKSDDYNNWIINRKSDEVSVTEMGNSPSVTRKSKYEYSTSRPFLVTSLTNSPSASIVNPLTTKTDYVYDVYGNVTSETRSAPYGIYNEPSVTTQYGYYNHRLLNSKTVDPNGLAYSESYCYDNYDRLTSSTGSDNLSTTYSYGNTFGTVVTTTRPGNVSTTESIEWASGNSLSPTNALYYKEIQDDNKPNTTKFYDAAGNVIRTATDNHQLYSVVVDTYYNDRQLPTQRSNPYEGDVNPMWTTFTYDGFGRIITSTAPDGTTVSNSYDGLTTTVTTSSGNSSRTTEKTTNYLGWVTCNTDASGAVVTYTYYSDGQPATMTTSGGNVVAEMEYDDAGNRTVLDDPDYGETTYTYDAYGRLVRQDTPKSDYFEYSYDILGRITQKSVHGDATTTTYQYNENSHKGTLASIIHTGQRLDYTYDSYNRVTTINETRVDTAYVTRYEYDNHSKISAKTYPSGYKVYYEYFPNGVKKKVKDARGNTLWQTNDINAFGQLKRAATGNGAVTTNTYHAPTHRLIGSVTSNGIQSFTYTYDGFGNLTSRTDSIGTVKTETFAYDNLDRLTGITLNNISNTIVYDNYGRMTDKEKEGSTVFENAKFGITKPHATISAITTPDAFPMSQALDYTSLDKVSSISQGTKIAAFTYGYDAQRTRLVVTDTLTGHIKQKDYVGSCEFVNDNGVKKVYTYLAGPYGVFAVVVKSGGVDAVDYIYKDNLGSWTTITDSVGGIVERRSFDAWGNLRNASTWTGTPNRIPKFDRGYTGHEHLYNFGLINMNGRMYDPVLSSFLSPDNYMQDPTTQQGFNRYAYCMYNPLKYVDPSGERIVGWDPLYLAIMEASEVVLKQWFSDYSVAMASNELTQRMSSNLYSHGHETNGSGNHGAAGGGSVEVKSLGNGKYQTVNGLYDGGNTVYVVDEQGNRTGEILGYTLTPYTFYDGDGLFVNNAIIDLNDYSGQNFLDDFINNPPDIFTYMTDIIHGDNGTDISLYNFKVFGYDSNRDTYDTYIYRSMLINYGDGLYFATARDIGNFAAGYLCGINGIPYSMTRIAFDSYQFRNQRNLEPPVSQLAQDCGYYWGRRLFSQTIQIPFYYLCYSIYR